MSLSIENLTNRFEKVFTPRQAETLATAIHDAYADVAKASDFSELKAVVQQIADAQRDLAQAQRDLAQAQGRTEARLEELAQAQRDLAQAQGRTEARLEELAQA
ncbi:MAG TPA: hypothetical protein GYA08_17705, partial [Chloroflexi bacterium]|nr:hypothetical protein [Chloroflexota bacterium]